MHRIVTGATGLIGGQLVNHWLREGHKVSVIGRSKSHIEAVFSDRVRAIRWEDLSSHHLQSADLIVNLAGANVGAGRFTPARKQAILSSRIHATRAIAEKLAEIGPNAPPLFNASAIGIYGTQQQLANSLPPRLSEEAQAVSQDFLAQVGSQWEQAASPAIDQGVKVVFLRFGVVLAKEGGALPKLVLPFHFFMGGPMGTGYQPVSWVAIDDVVRAIDFIFASMPLSGPFNIVAPGVVSQRDFAKMIGEVLSRPALLPMPASILSLMVGKEMAQALLLEGQNVYPQRLLDLGFQFQYPDLKSALIHLLKN